jgi:prepilin-type N-terminal cleavage/methylation domain-containing protein
VKPSILNSQHHNSAFTLVELAIVIVIIGILVGGALTGQSIIESAKRSKVVSDYEMYNKALMAFHLEYDALPGDFDEATQYWGEVSGNCYTSGSYDKTCDGGGDGRIDYDCGNGNRYEAVTAWQHLSLAEILNEKFIGRSLYGSCIRYSTEGDNKNVPAGPYDDSMWAIFNTPANYGFTSNSPVLKQKYGNATYLVFGYKNGPSSWNNRWHNPPLTTEQARAIDKKFDDGNPYKGLITDLGANSYSPDCTTAENVNAEYDLSYEEKACILMFETTLQ